MYFITHSSVISSNGVNALAVVHATNNIRVHGSDSVCWTSGDAVVGCDTGDSRLAADVEGVGNGTPGDTSGKLKAAGYMSIGTTFTTNNGCTDAATAGGATAGTFTVGAAVTSCTEVITMGNSATAPNGWSCNALDLTTGADVTNPHQTATSTTTATIVTGTIVASDKIQFSCFGY